MDHGKPIIYVKNVRKVYRMGDEEVVALKRINLRIYKGEVCCIFGTSGSGKSTLLNQLAGMEKPTKGQVFIRGKNISDMNEEELAAFRQEHMSFIFQSYNLLPSMTAVENVAMPLMFKGMDRKRREAMAEEMLKRVGLSHRLHHYPSQMSGGQQQRAGIARAFVSRPEVVFADEPTGNLDTKTTAEIMDMVMGFARRFNQTIILVTHDPGHRDTGPGHGHTAGSHDTGWRGNTSRRPGGDTGSYPVRELSPKDSGTRDKTSERERGNRTQPGGSASNRGGP